MSNRTRSGVAVSMRSQLVEQVGRVIGPPCIHCHEPVRMEPAQRQGWIHNACRVDCEAAERERAKAESAAVGVVAMAA